MWASKEAKLIICIVFFFIEFKQCLESSDSDPMQYKHMKNGKEE